MNTQADDGFIHSYESSITLSPPLEILEEKKAKIETQDFINF